MPSRSIAVSREATKNSAQSSSARAPLSISKSDKPPASHSCIEIPLSAVPAININLFKANDELPDMNVFVALGCSSETAEEIANAVSDALNRIKDLEKSSSRVLKSDAGKFVEISPFKLEGSQIRNDLNETLHKLLPDGRADVIMANLDRNVRFGGFGAFRREFSAELNKIGDAEVWGYTLKVDEPGLPVKTLGGSALNVLFAARFKHLTGGR